MWTDFAQSNLPQTASTVSLLPADRFPYLEVLVSARSCALDGSLVLPVFFRVSHKSTADLWNEGKC